VDSCDWRGIVASHPFGAIPAYVTRSSSRRGLGLVVVEDDIFTVVDDDSLECDDVDGDVDSKISFTLLR